jgi:hypothetical protein
MFSKYLYQWRFFVLQNSTKRRSNQALSQGGASRYNARTAYLVALTRNLENIRDIHAGREESITKPILGKKKHSCYWQRARAANDRYVIDSEVKNALSY